MIQKAENQILHHILLTAIYLGPILQGILQTSMMIKSMFSLNISFSLLWNHILLYFSKDSGFLWFYSQNPTIVQSEIPFTIQNALSIVLFVLLLLFSTSVLSHALYYG